MASVLEYIYFGGPLALLCFLVIPAAAWVAALLAGLHGWRALRSQPLEVPPSVHGGLVWRVYGMITFDVVVFGFVLWILWSPLTGSLAAGGLAVTVNAEFGVLAMAGVVYAETAVVVCLTQALVFHSWIRDLIGPFSARVQALLALPVLGGICSLLAGYRGLVLVTDMMALPGGPTASSVAAASIGFISLGVAILGVPVGTILGLREDVAVHDGFARAAIRSLVGILPAVVTVVLWALTVAA